MNCVKRWTNGWLLKVGVGGRSHHLVDSGQILASFGSVRGTGGHFLEEGRVVQTSNAVDHTTSAAAASGTIT